MKVGARGYYILEQPPIIFIHVPKNAGSSINRLIRNLGGCSFGRRGHSRLNNHLSTLKAIYPEAKLVGCIRNPWDRLLSGYFFLRAGGRNHRDQIRRILTWPLIRHDFTAFIRKLRKHPQIFSPSPSETRHLRKIFPYIHLLPQWYWVCDDNRKLLLDSVLRFENLEDSLTELLSLTVQPNSSPGLIPRLNVSSHPDYRELYTPELIEIVAELYDTDISLFGYSFT